MKKSIVKKTCLVMAIVSSMAAFTGCNKKLDPKFEVTASDYVKVGDYKGITVDVDEAAITKTFVDKKVQSDLDTLTTYEATSRESQAEDQITVAFTGKIAGTTVEGFCSDEYSLVLGKDQFTVPGFVEVLYGLKAGDTKVVTLTVPAGITDAEDYANKRIVYDITVLTVEAPVAPMVTDAYVKANFSYNTVAEYRVGLEADMKTEIDEEIYDAKLAAVMNKLQENTEVISYPEEMLAVKLEALNKSMTLYSTMYGYSNEDYAMKTYGVTVEEFAKKAIVQELILEQIVKLENMSIDEYYYKGNLTAFAADRGYTSVDSFVEKFGKDMIVKNMLIQKAVDFVMDNATS